MRIGDVVAIPHGELAITASEVEPGASSLVGMHGSVVPAEQLVPLLGSAVRFARRDLPRILAR